MGQQATSEEQVIHVLVSYSDVIKPEDRRRAVKIPTDEEVPVGTGKIIDPALGIEVPAAVGVTFTFVRQEPASDGTMQAQWTATFWPSHPRLEQRAAQEDARRLVKSALEDAMLEHPKYGATVRGYFAVPCAGSGPDNRFQLILQGVGGLFAGAMRDPWGDPETYERVEHLLYDRLHSLCQLLWLSWSHDPEVRDILMDQQIPVTPSDRTQFMRASGRVEHLRILRELLPESAQRTQVGHDTAPRPVVTTQTTQAAQQPTSDWGMTALLIGGACALGAFAYIFYLTLG